MNHDYLDPSNALNMPELADTSLANDFLLRAKEAVRNTAIALTESPSPEVRDTLKKQLLQGIALHQEIYELMHEKKWFHPHDMKEQYKIDQLSAKNTAMIAEMDLFIGNTNRKGMFDRTPDEH